MSEEHTFDILGFKLKVRSDENEQLINAKDVSQIVRDEAYSLKEKSPNLSNGEIAILLALKYAKEKLVLEKEYETNIQELQNTAKDALARIEESQLSVQ